MPDIRDDRWTFDLVIAWDWEFDHELVLLLKGACATHGLRVLDITVYDLKELLDRILSGKLHINVLLDRASDANLAFMPLQKWALEKGVRVINPYKVSEWAMNKATIHPKLIEAGLYVPNTVILPSYQEKYALEQWYVDEIAKLPRPFVIKPAKGGGGEGVVKSAWTYEQVLWHRQEYAGDLYLVQEKIYPKYRYGWRCWFRAYYIFGNIEISWWDDEILRYRTVSAHDRTDLALWKMEDIMRAIAGISKMDFFSSEIVITQDDRFVVIDYVNDQVDMRPRSRHYDGVPDDIIRKVVENTCRFVGGYVSQLD
jgi:hypothetical protein